MHICSYPRTRINGFRQLKILEKGAGNILWVQLDTNRTLFISVTTYASSDVGSDELMLSSSFTVTNNRETNDDMIAPILLIFIIASIFVTVVFIYRKSLSK